MSGPRLLRIASVMVLVTGAALAEDSPRAGRGHVPPPPDLTARPAVSAGVGVGSFIGQPLRGVAGMGASWNVRAAMGSLADVRIELVYAGSVQPITGAEREGARLIGHGVHGLLRANVAPNRVFEPFLYFGAGWIRFQVTGPAGGDLRSPDHVLEIPFGLGIARRSGRFVLDARAGLSIINAADLVPRRDPASSGGENMHRAGLCVSVGLEL